MKGESRRLSKLTKKELIEMLENLEDENKHLKEKLKYFEKAEFVDFNTDEVVIEPLAIVAIGTLKAKGIFKIIGVDLGILKKVMKLVEDFNGVSGGHIDRIDIGLTDDFPLLIGNYDKETDKFKGFVIAPKE